VNDGFLEPRQLRVPHLHAQVAARHHDDVGRVDDPGQVVDRLVPLDLGHDARVAAGLAQQRARFLDVARLARK
jgi:hypothetical protein